MKLLSTLIVFLMVISVFAQSQNPRIQQLFLNRSTTQKIFLSPGLATSVKMPCEIDEVITPGSGILNHISERNKTRFSLEISHVARSTNFIVHCVDSTYVFDLVVNKKIHNDYIEVIGDYGVPRLTKFPFFKSDKLRTKKIADLEIAPRNSLMKQIESNRSEFDFNSIDKIKVFSSK